MTTDIVNEPTTVQQPEGDENAEEPEIVIPKGMKVKKMPKPDKTGHEMQVTRLKQKIDEQYTRINEIKEAIDLKKAAKDGISGQAAGNREKLNKLHAEFKTTLEEKKAVQARIQGLRDLQRQIRDESKQLRETVQGSYFKVEDIDKEIARLEARIAHEGLDLTEEKRVMEQIRSLNKSRAAVKEFSVKATSMEAKVSGMEDLDASLKALNAKLDKITAEKEAERKNIGAMLGKANEETSDIPALIAERKAISQVITHLREELSNVRDNWKKVNDVWWNNEKMFKAQLAQERKARFEEREKERAQRDQEREKEEKGPEKTPFEDEIAACEALVVYLKQMSETKAAVKKEAAVEEDTIGGFSVVKKEHDTLFGDMVKAKGKKGKKPSKDSVANPAKTPVMLSPDTLSTFSMIKVSVPLTKADCASRVPLVEEKLAEYKSKQAAKLAQRAAAKPEEPADEAAPAPEAAPAEEPEAAPPKEAVLSPTVEGESAPAAEEPEEGEVADESA